MDGQRQRGLSRALDQPQHVDAGERHGGLRRQRGERPDRRDECGHGDDPGDPDRHTPGTASATAAVTPAGALAQTGAPLLLEIFLGALAVLAGLSPEHVRAVAPGSILKGAPAALTDAP